MKEIFQSQFEVKVHHEDGSYWAEVPEMPGLFVSGDSIEEIREALAEAIGLYLTSENVSINVQTVELNGPGHVVLSELFQPRGRGHGLSPGFP